jgi:TPR repeat protein
MSDTNLAFVRKISEPLARYYELAYRYCYEDPENSLVKLRSGAALLLDELRGEAARGGSLYERLRGADWAQWMPHHIQEKLDFLRVQGNKGAHPERSFRSRAAAAQTALAALQTAYKIAAWIGEEIRDIPLSEIPPFAPPDQRYSDKLYGDAVSRNQPEAQYSVGLMCKQKAEQAFHEVRLQARRAKLPPPNPALDPGLQDAFYWLRKAAAQDHPAAMYQLGVLYLHGMGVARQMEHGAQMIRRAAELKDADALHLLGCFYLDGTILGLQPHSQDVRKAFEYFKNAARQEHPGAFDRLVQIYYEGLGVAVNHDKAFAYAHQAALAGYPSAQFKLAYLYRSGIGVEANEAEAFRWYREAALGGNADAQIVLFKYYSSGLHVRKDLVEALEWLQQAEAQDHPGASYYLGLACRRGIGVKVNLARALALFKRCIELDTDNQYEAAKAEFAAAMEELRQQARQQASLRAGLPKESLPPPDKKVGRNDPCPCGSGKKYKKCCMLKLS